MKPGGAQTIRTWWQVWVLLCVLRSQAKSGVFYRDQQSDVWQEKIGSKLRTRTPQRNARVNVLMF